MLTLQRNFKSQKVSEVKTVIFSHEPSHDLSVTVIIKSVDLTKKQC